MSGSDEAKLQLVLVSDTHELHRSLDIPLGDILIHAGDFTTFSQSQAMIKDFNAWLGELPHRHKIVCPGNHDYCLEVDSTKRSLLSNATVLIDEGVEIEGLRFWGSPITPLYGGAFGLSSAADRKKAYAKIPVETDILITHSPPYGLLDVNPLDGVHYGCHELFKAVKRVQPALHVFGHIHGAHGTLLAGHTLFANAAVVGTDFSLEHAPIMVRLGSQ